MSEAGEFALYLASGAVGLALLLGPIGQAVARLITGKRAGADPKTGLTTGEMAAERIAALEGRVHELEGELARLAELEERIEFAERVLGRLPPGTALEPEKTLDGS